MNSSASNRRGIFDHDQYANWAGGAGFTVKQGFRVGASMYRGPYLDRQFPFYLAGEAPPNQLPATAVGVDVSFGHGPWNLLGECRRFQMDYHKINDYIHQVGYVEARRTLGPRWYLAARASYSRASAGAPYRVYEVAGGYRPSRFELIKCGYEIEQGPAIRTPLDGTVLVQFITTFGPLSASRN